MEVVLAQNSQLLTVREVTMDATSTRGKRVMWPELLESTKLHRNPSILHRYLMTEKLLTSVSKELCRLEFRLLGGRMSFMKGRTK